MATVRVKIDTREGHTLHLNARMLGLTEAHLTVRDGCIEVPETTYQYCVERLREHDSGIAK